jgi:REP-associated tyrosine transposase
MIDGEGLKHSRWECKYHLMSIPKYRKEVLYGANISR